MDADLNVFDFGDSIEDTQPVNDDPSGIQNDDLQNTDDDPSQITSSNEPEDFMTTILRRGGIDRNAVRMANDDGEIEEVEFDSLSDSDKIAVLDSIKDPAISDDEINTINFLRQNKMSLNDFAAWQRNEAIKQYEADANKPDYTVDKLDDDSLFKFALLEKYGDMTDEELDSEVETAKSKPELYAKKISALRAEYSQLEDDERQRAEQEAQAKSEAEFNEMAQALVDVARSTDSLHNMQLEDDDKENILSTLLDRDANGKSEFYKYFEDPDKLFRMCWYMKYGDQAFQALDSYYKGLVQNARRQNQAPTLRTIRKQTKTTNEDAFDLDKQYKNI